MKKIFFIIPIFILLVCIGGEAEPVARDEGFSIGKPYRLSLNGLKQTILVNSNSSSNPVLLVLHGGPGYAMLSLMHDINPQLEDEFIVVNWDQRGAGLSPQSDPSRLTLNQLVMDAHELSRWLKEKFGQRKIYLLGHSFGTVIGLKLIKEYPDDYFAFIGVGQTINVVKNEQYSYDWAYQQAKNNSDANAIQLLEAIGRPSNEGDYLGKIPDKYSDTFEDGSEVTSYYVSYYGGEIHGSKNSDKIDDLIISSGLYDENEWIQNWKYSQSIFQDSEVWNFNLMKKSQGFQYFNVPVYFFMGEHDYDTPVNLFEEYYTLLKSKKEYIHFKNSAHFPFYEEPVKFRTELSKIKADTYK